MFISHQICHTHTIFPFVTLIYHTHISHSYITLIYITLISSHSKTLLVPHHFAPLLSYATPLLSPLFHIPCFTPLSTHFVTFMPYHYAATPLSHSNTTLFLSSTYATPTMSYTNITLLLSLSHHTLSTLSPDVRLIITYYIFLVSDCLFHYPLLNVQLVCN